MVESRWLSSTASAMNKLNEFDMPSRGTTSFCGLFSAAGTSAAQTHSQSLNRSSNGNSRLKQMSNHLVDTPCEQQLAVSVERIDSPEAEKEIQGFRLVKMRVQGRIHGRDELLK